LNFKADENSDRNNGCVRLQVYLSHAGVASRRAAEKLILDGRVAVNGSIVTGLGSKVELSDRICVDTIEVRPEKIFHYIALYKPVMYLCSSVNEEAGRGVPGTTPQAPRTAAALRPLAKDLLPLEIKERLYSIGRLDYLSSGLILFTNDGDFAARLGHPRAEIEKEYLVEATGPIPDALIDGFKTGLEIENIVYKSKNLERIDRKTVKIILVEGKNREIRRVFSHFHLHPRRLLRVRIGPVLLGDLKEGKTRPLNRVEMEKLQAYGHRN
jgi:23S rRNA pseudouridine2605 synthase